VSYTGLDSKELSVLVQPGRTTTQEIGLTSGVYEMETFVVADAREGQAAAITLPRVAPNVKSIVATDAFGNIADGNIAEFAKRLPGVAADYAQLEAQRLIIRGMSPDLNTVTFDGTSVPIASNNTRGVSINEFPIRLIEMIEVTKSPTPNMDGDSIGGNVNLKPKSVFDRAEPRLITFSANVNFRINERSKYTPSLNLSYCW
jgi:iron complex outermembrane recepter protein